MKYLFMAAIGIPLSAIQLMFSGMCLAVGFKIGKGICDRVKEGKDNADKASNPKYIEY